MIGGILILQHRDEDKVHILAFPEFEQALTEFMKLYDLDVSMELYKRRYEKRRWRKSAGTPRYQLIRRKEL